jgi:hypothetical protein
MLHEPSHVYHSGTAHLQNEQTFDGKLCEACLAFSRVTNPASGTLFMPSALAAAPPRQPRSGILHHCSGCGYAWAAQPRTSHSPLTSLYWARGDCEQSSAAADLTLKA